MMYYLITERGGKTIEATIECDKVLHKRTHTYFMQDGEAILIIRNDQILNLRKKTINIGVENKVRHVSDPHLGDIFLLSNSKRNLNVKDPLVTFRSKNSNRIGIVRIYSNEYEKLLKDDDITFMPNIV